MAHVYITRRLPKDLLSKFLSNNITYSMWDLDAAIPREELIKNVSSANGLLCMLSDKIDDEIISKANNLKAISTLSVGYDHIDLNVLKARNIRLGYTPDILTDATAELTVSLLLTVSRRILEASQSVSNGSWGTWSPFWMCGKGLAGSVVGVVGLGRIGRAVATRLAAFRPSRLVYSSSRPSEASPVPLGVMGMVAEPLTLDGLLECADFVIVCCAFNEKTKLLFNSEAFDKMKPGAVFVNSSRGGVVDQDALIRALQRGLKAGLALGGGSGVAEIEEVGGSTNGDVRELKRGCLAGAGLDVTTPEPLPVDSELLRMPNCVVLPHIGSATTDTRRSMVQLCVDNLITSLTSPTKPMPAEVKLA